MTIGATGIEPPATTTSNLVVHLIGSLPTA
jgi:hypothetical protein